MNTNTLRDEKSQLEMLKPSQNGPLEVTALRTVSRLRIRVVKRNRNQNP